MQASRLVLAGLVAFAIGIATWLSFRSLPKFKPRSGENDVVAVVASATDAGAPTTSASSSATAQPTPSKPKLQTIDEAPQYDGPVRDRKRADELRELLTTLYAGQLAAEDDDAARPDAGQADGVMPKPVGDGNQSDKPLGAYVKRMMQEQFTPLAGECYDQLLDRTPFVEGNVTLRFSIMGDPAVGGVVVDVGFGRGTTLNDTEFVTCVRESLYAVVFDAPPKGNSTVTVEQSLEFTP